MTILYLLESLRGESKMTWTQSIAKCIENEDMRANLMQVPIAIIASREWLPDYWYWVAYLRVKSN